MPYVYGSRVNSLSNIQRNTISRYSKTYNLLVLYALLLTMWYAVGPRGGRVCVCVGDAWQCAQPQVHYKWRRGCVPSSSKALRVVPLEEGNKLCSSQSTTLRLHSRVRILPCKCMRLFCSSLDMIAPENMWTTLATFLGISIERHFDSV